MHDVALIEIVVIKCYFNNNFILMIMILMNKVVRHICLFICVYVPLGVSMYLWVFE